MNNQDYTFRAVNIDGSAQFYYCAQKEIKNYMTVAEYQELKYVEILNAKNDKVKHRKISKEEM